MTKSAAGHCMGEMLDTSMSISHAHKLGAMDQAMAASDPCIVSGDNRHS